jgi:hypothetical protein
MSVKTQRERLNMKKWILAAVAVAVVGMGTQTARAGDREWATVGKVLTGVAAGVVIANALDAQPAYASVHVGSPGYSVSYSVCAPPPCPPPRVVCAPPPVVVYQPVVCAPYRVVYASADYGPGRGHGWGHGHHGRSHGHGHWGR